MHLFWKNLNVEAKGKRMKPVSWGSQAHMWKNDMQTKAPGDLFLVQEHISFQLSD